MRVQPAELCITVTASEETGGPYPVWIGSGLSAALPPRLRELDPAHRWALISDRTVAELHGRRIERALAEAGFAVDLFEVEPGETQKTRETWARLTDAMLERGLGRDSAVIALGGGVIGDLAGFVAATYMRGVPCVQVPSTLLAMIDASVGGKTGVDVPAGKNLVGVIRQPRLVIIDPDLLVTLPRKVFVAGLAEAVKHGAIADADYLADIADHRAGLLDREPAPLVDLIRRSIEIKAGIVARDTTETGERAALNFGHTIAHALETVSGHTLAHGEAVAAGMVAEARLGELLGVTEPGTSAHLRELLTDLELPAAIPPAAARAILRATATDKKARASRVRYTLLERIGRVAQADGRWTFEADDATVLRALEDASGDTTLSLDFTEI